MINNVEHLSICLLASCMSSLEKYLFASSPLFKSDYLVFVIELHELFIYLGPVILYKKLPANAGDTGNTALMPGSGRSPGEGNGIHSGVVAYGIPWREVPGRLQSTGSQTARNN